MSSRSKGQKRPSARDSRAGQKARAEAQRALRIMNSQNSRSSETADRRPHAIKLIPTIVRQVFVDPDSPPHRPEILPGHLHDLLDFIESERVNAHRKPMVQVHSRRSGLIAARRHDFSEAGLHDRARDALDRIDGGEVTGARIGAFAIMGVSRNETGMRFVTGIFDQVTQERLLREHEAVAKCLGYEHPLPYKTPLFHLSVAQTPDQRLASEIREECARAVSWAEPLAKFVLGPPELKVVELDPARRYPSK